MFKSSSVCVACGVPMSPGVEICPHCAGAASVAGAGAAGGPATRVMMRDGALLEVAVPGMATLHADIVFTLDDDDPQRRRLTLHGRAGAGEDLSVLTPLGLALLGARPGDRFLLRRPDEEDVRVHVLAVDRSPARAGERPASLGGGGGR